MRQIIGVLRKNHKKIKSASTAAAMVPSSSSTSWNAPMEQGYPFMHMMFEYLQQQKVQASGGVHFTFPEKRKKENREHQKLCPGRAAASQKRSLLVLGWAVAL